MLQFRKSNILIVEDDPVIRQMAAVLLEELGYGILQVESAVPALTQLEESADTIGAVFTNVEMPGQINGLVLARIIELSWPRIPVLITSGGRPLDEDLPERSCFLAKPWRALDVINMVEQLAR